MPIPFHYFLSLLFLCSLLPSISHSQNTQIDISLNETEIVFSNETTLYYKMNLSRGDLDTFKYIVIKTNPDDYINPAHLYISQSSYYPSNSNYDYSSHKEGENMIYMDTSTLVEGVLYIGIICEDACKFGLQSYPSERLLLLDNYEEIHIIPTTATTEFYFHPRADTDDMFVYVIGEKDENFEVIVQVLNETDNTILQRCEVQQCFYEGYGASISLHNGTSHETVVVIIVKMDIRTAKQKLTVGAVINDFIIPTNMMEQTFGIINNDVINEQCYMLVQEEPDKDIIFFIESHTHGVTFLVRNATDEAYDIILQENVMFNNWTIVESNVLIGNIFCFKSPNETNTHNHLTSYVFQYTYSEPSYFINSQPYIDSLSEGVFYEHYIPPGLQTYYKRKLILPQYETVYANFIPLIGESKVYPYVCQSFPYCRIDNSIMEEIIENDNGEGYFNINNQVTFKYDTTSLSALNNEKLVFVVKCSEDSVSGCTYMIEIDNGGEIELPPNMNFVALSNRNNKLYFRTSNNYYINNLRFITTSLTGISSPDMDGINYKLESAGNKQIYHFVKQTSKRFKVNSLNFDSVYFAKFAFGETNDTLLTLNYTYTEFITFANEKKRFYIDIERDIPSGNAVILNIKGVNCVTKVTHDSTEYIANKTHEMYITQSPNEDNIVVFDVSVVAFDNNSTSVNEICVVHISAVDNQYTRGVSFFENEEHVFTMSDNKENNVRYFNFPVNFGKTKEQFPFHFLNFELSEQTHFELTLAVNSMNHVFAVYQLYKSDIFLLGNKLYENCRAFSEACLLVVKLEKKSSTASTVNVAVTFNSKNERPIYLEKNKQIKQYMPNKPQAKFMYTDIGLNETGSVTFNFQKQPNNIYASIFRKDKIYTYDWLGRLPLHYYYSEQLTYDVYTNSFYYNETQTSKCENGCELLVIYEQDKYIHSKSIVINQFTVYVTQQNTFTHVLPNEDIQITFTSEEEKHFFRFVMPNDTDSPRLMVQIDSNFGKLLINAGLDVPNDITHDYAVNANDINFIIDASDSHIQKTSLKGVTFTFYASLTTYIEGDSYIKFKLIPQYTNSSAEFNVIRTSYSQHEVCRIPKDNDYCHFLMYIPDDLPIQRIYTYAESRLSPNFMLTTTANVLAKETVETQYYSTHMNIAELFPTKEQYDKKNNEQENYLEIMTDETAEPMVYVFISVYSEKATDIDFYVSNMVNVRQFQLSSNEKQLIYIPKETKSFWEVKPDMDLKIDNVNVMLYSTVLHGTGLFTIVNEIGGDFIVHPKFSFSRGFDVTEGKDFVNLIDGDHGSSMLMLGSFTYFMYDRHLERLSMNYVNEYELAANNYPFQFYTPLSTEKTADLIIKFYNRFDYQVTNYDLPFQITAALVSEEYLNSKRQGIDYNVTKSLNNVTFVDTFDFALIRYHLDMIMNESINANKHYLYIEVQRKNYYDRLYENSNLVIGLSSQQHNFRMTIPRGKYIYNTFDIADANEVEHVYIMNTGQLPKHTALQVDVGESVHYVNNHEALSFEVEPNPDNPFCGANRMKHWNVTRQHINGKDVIIGYIGQTVCSEYIVRVKKHPKCKVNKEVLTKKIGYAVKFTTSSEINEHNYNDESLSTYAPRYKIEEGFNFTTSATNSSIKNITLRTISYVDDDLYTPFYYIRVYSAKEVKDQQAVSSLFPIGIDDKEVVHPVYQHLFKTNNQSTIVTHLFELSGDIKDYYVSVIVNVKKGQDEQSIGVYKPYSSALSTFVVLVIIVAIVIVALVGVGGFFLYKFFLKLSDDEKVVKEIDGVGSLIDPSNPDSIVSNENPHVVNANANANAHHEGEINQLDNDDNNQIAEI